MSIASVLSEPELWQTFLAHKRAKHQLTKSEDADLCAFIEAGDYVPVVERIRTGGAFPLPEKLSISKSGTGRKRVVYRYPRAENQVFKLLTYLLLRKYDACFPDSLYSFRAHGGAAPAVRKLLATPELDAMYTYKADVSNYFNSIPVPRLLPILRRTLADEPEICRTLEQLLIDDRALENGQVVREEKGVMAGVPFAVFLANLYLTDLDRDAEERGYRYARYSDDILVLARTGAERDSAGAWIREQLESRGLSVNPEKEIRTGSGEPWSFLGIEYRSGTVDISGIAFGKLKAKIRRKARAIKRWQIRKGATGEQAARAFIRAMNRKLFRNPSGSELTWARWYFPVITTDATLRRIDAYLGDWVRFLVTGRHREGNRRIRYEQLKGFGFLSLVNAWYRYRENGNLPLCRRVPADGSGEPAPRARGCTHA